MAWDCEQRKKTSRGGACGTDTFSGSSASTGNYQLLSLSVCLSVCMVDEFVKHWSWQMHTIAMVFILHFCFVTIKCAL